jgi:hypothetical protein
VTATFLISVLVFSTDRTGFSADTPPSRKPSLEERAWDAWRNGDVSRTEEYARTLVGIQESRDHGHYLGRREKETAYQVIDALCHVGDYSGAAAFALKINKEKAPNRSDGAQSMVSFLSNYPPVTSDLKRVTTVPFEGEFIPKFEIVINGKKVESYFDTGAPFLVIETDLAEELGMPRAKPGVGVYGVAEEMRLSEAVLRNVPAFIGKNKKKPVIIGTNVLQRFLSTVDYHNKRFIFSPRGDEALNKEHFALLPKQRVEVPFHIYGDHFMYAKGGVGDHGGLNFFIDSGLVALWRGNDGITRQAAFLSSRDNYLGWGIEGDRMRKGQPVFSPGVKLALGPLSQPDHLFMKLGRIGWGSGYWGIRMDGLLSHAFLSQYSWTIDFDRMVYEFGIRPD